MAKHPAEEQAAPRVPADAVAAPHDGPLDRLRPAHLYRTAGLAFLLLLLFKYWEQLTHVFLLGYAAAILAVILNAVRRKLHMKRKWLAAIVGLVVVGSVVGALAVGMPVLLKQAKGIMQTGPALEEQIAKWEKAIQEQTGMKIDIPHPSSMLKSSAGGQGGGGMMGRAASFMEILFIPLILFFGGLFALANPNDRLLTPMMRVLPEDVRLAWYRIFQLLNDRLIGWAKGTATAMVAVAILSTVAFWVIGVPNAVALGLFNGTVEFIPLFGPWIGGMTAVVVAFLDDPQKAMWVAIAALAIQQIEANLITPWSMSRNAEVHPFVTLFALVLFGGLFGFLGILLALPLVMLVWTIVQVLWVERAIDTDRERIAPVVSE
ncbi:AI-2E family transporter [Longimicrobium sp.]|uniref:AI-2E family transporter n=1 Tax=Longimicrobium sp. TaxID=2029185 RepID=UPI003B3BDCB3